MSDIVERLRKLIKDAEPAFPETEAAVTIKFAREIAAEIERLRAVLSFYGDYLSYGRGTIRFEGERPEVMKDNGKMARRVLEGK